MRGLYGNMVTMGNHKLNGYYRMSNELIYEPARIAALDCFSSLLLQERLYMQGLLIQRILGDKMLYERNSVSFVQEVWQAD